MNIPFIMKHIWVGPNPAPSKWMQTWPKLHSNWEYSVFTDNDLKNRTFYNQHLIDEYYSRGKFNGVSDLIRYELLYETGGFFPEADSKCLNSVDELFTEDTDTCYTVYEHETIKPGFVSPILAANPGNKFLEQIIEKLHKLTPNQLTSKVWACTGNEFLMHTIKEFTPKIKIFPSHYFIPEHYSGKAPRYTGPDKIYCDQLWGSTHKNYNEGV